MLAPLLFDHLPTPAELLPEGSWVVVAEAPRTRDRAAQTLAEATALAEASGWPGRRRSCRSRTPSPGAPCSRSRASPRGSTWGSPTGARRRATPPSSRTRLADLAGRGYHLVVTARGRGSLERVKEVIPRDLGEVDRRGAAANGFVFAPAKLAVATEEDVFGSRRHTRAAPRFTRRRTDTLAQELEPGDFAVHRIHGVGRYAGSRTALSPAPSATT